MEEMSIKEMATILGISPNTTKKRLQYRNIKPVKYIPVSTGGGFCGLYSSDVIPILQDFGPRGKHRPKPVE